MKFSVLFHQNDFITEEEENNVITVMKAAYLSSILSISFTAYKDIDLMTSSIDEDTISNVLLKNQKSFDCMERASTYAQSVGIEMMNRMVFVRSIEGKYMKL